MLYAHFDASSKVEDYVLYSLEKSLEVCRDIIFLSTSPVSAEDRSRIGVYCRNVFEKNNDGFDFGMWKHALGETDLDEYDELVLLNSSVYGPLFPLGDIFAAMADCPVDFWGMTESYEIDRHLQSYFLVFRKKVITSPAFHAFWDSVLDYRSKAQAIRSYEVGLSQWLLDNGFSSGAYCSWQALLKLHQRQGVIDVFRIMNPSVRYPAELIAMGMPYVKKEVLSDNPLSLDLGKVRAAIANTGYPAALIADRQASRVRDSIKTQDQHSCPICGGTGRALYKNLKDQLKVIGPPVWHIRRCNSRSCSVAWVHPRPLESDIHKAYQSYYTHGSEDHGPSRHSPPSQSWPSLPTKVLVKISDMLGLTKNRVRFYFHGLLNRPPGRLLEIGCGGGGRLAGLKERGWEVEGQEVDPKAVENCRSQGLNVHLGAVHSLGLPPQSYDVILLSHVLEHLHDQAGLLRYCRDLLKPGGQIVISTPNIEALGRLIFRRCWHPLDPPRHLVLFNRNALKKLLKDAGFENIRVATVAYNTELTSIHSLDNVHHNFTDGDTLPRVGKVFVPVLIQLVALFLVKILPAIGEECFATASPRL